MEVLDVNGNPLESYDLQTGHIVVSNKTVHHEAVDGVDEHGHYETIREYPETGGKDVTWVVDVPGVQGYGAWDEEVPVNTFVPYTANELAQIEAAKSAPTEAERLTAVEAALLELVLGGVSGG